MTPWLWRLGAVAGLAGLWWASRALAGARWQVAACIPVAQEADGRWRAVNLTWYGILSAVAYSLAVALAVALGAGLGSSLGAMLAMAGVVLAVCMPASRVVAWLVEGKSATLTVGGAVFVALWVTPLAAWLAQSWWGGAPWPAALAAVAVAYALGEGVGRLACCSFGCCYGRPVASLPQPWQRWLAPVAVRFWGPTKKAAYASGLEGVPLVPIQGMTAVVHGLAAWAGAEALVAGQSGLALVLGGAVPLLWRVASEFLRADFRGTARFSAYQRMALAGAAWVVLVAWWAPAVSAAFDAGAALAAVLSPAALATVALVFLVSLVYTGISRVTSAQVALCVRPERI